ncbi:hypothetical protein RhiJN_06443 [Ceratobasidium sp. AG-Ba]|nr:hypothetical protein RhiJN_06443 [Ceratobasidium sp. AG-Ba]QRW07357.1 hypothetical protein RhiLY_06356 [Ceratobasidium sp. AG-Ba]
MLAAYFCTVGYAFVSVTLLAQKNIYLVNPLPSVFSGCVMIFPEGIWKIYILPIAWEWTVFGLTIWKIWNLQESYGATPLMQRLAQNGIAYFVVLLLLFLFLTIGGSIEQIKIASNGSGFVVAISSVVCSRVIISLHEFKHAQQPQDTTVPCNSAGKLMVVIPLPEMSRPIGEP